MCFISLLLTDLVCYFLWSGTDSSMKLVVVVGIIALLLQDHRTMSTKSVCSSQYMMKEQH